MKHLIPHNNLSGELLIISVEFIHTTSTRYNYSRHVKHTTHIMLIPIMFMARGFQY